MAVFALVRVEEGPEKIARDCGWSAGCMLGQGASASRVSTERFTSRLFSSLSMDRLKGRLDAKECQWMD